MFSVVYSHHPTQFGSIWFQNFNPRLAWTRHPSGPKAEFLYRKKWTIPEPRKPPARWSSRPHDFRVQLALTGLSSFWEFRRVWLFSHEPKLFCMPLKAAQRPRLKIPGGRGFAGTLFGVISVGYSNSGTLPKLPTFAYVMKTLKASLLASAIGTAAWLLGLANLMWPAHPQWAVFLLTIGATAVLMWVLPQSSRSVASPIRK